MTLFKLSVFLNNRLHVIKLAYKKAFGDYLFVTNTVTYVSLYALGDALQQNIERKFLGREGPYDFKRSLRMALFATFNGPVNHFWYAALDKYVKGSLHKMVFGKVLIDQTLFAPYSAVAFFMGMGLLEGKSLQEAKQETSEKFIPTYIADISVWPAAQILNFYVVPNHLRLMYINVVTLAWNTFLSYMKHKDSSKEKNPENDVTKKEI